MTNPLAEGAYNVIREVQPELLPLIKRLLDLRLTPSQIATRVSPHDAGLAGLVEMAADHMRETKTRPAPA